MSLPRGVRTSAVMQLSLIHCILLITLFVEVCALLFSMFFFVSFRVLQSPLRQLWLCSYVYVYLLLDVVLVSFSQGAMGLVCDLGSWHFLVNHRSRISKTTTE